ncbi:MAG: 5-formyltetrahydrofolate cyclo-ligase [Methanocalculus sp. MSAO_Arc1]|uniref:5-formyltetrahydrofolate cyclo-ligase n=1 Tax=Methanocalculus TaxID=71151 RepID=UPI000FF70FCA|nr:MULTISPECIES: 5-formyltetrahydrofolate cyclo-ligase [unclassified Methanocalculus]MCP1662295.1 5-formyltetrahydrofolate cyclo-ligase [Methanocalculus sp. AMF5]RQD80944.1 MAG: 5-formyltetrahydrofolate cyclo-ligase [Methanocalculus sp. MSAO_Arc1]
MAEDKETIRNILRQRKELQTPDERFEKSRRICSHLMKMIQPKETVMVYTSKEKEVNTVPLITMLLAYKNPVIVPIIQKEDYTLRLSYLEDMGVLIPSTFGVPEPIGSEIPARGEDVDTIILPMLGFDRRGGRIGYGAGYYDRFLSMHPEIRKIGIAFAFQEIEALPLDPHDIIMDAIITEDGVVYKRG